MYTTGMVRIVWVKLISFDLQHQIHKKTIMVLISKACTEWCWTTHMFSQQNWYPLQSSKLQVKPEYSETCPLAFSLGATARSYRRQDGADAAARFEKFLPARASLRPPISLKFTTEKQGGMVRLAPKRQPRTFSRFCTIIPERFAARRR